MTPRTKATACGCVDTMNEALEARGVELDVATMLSTGAQFPIIATRSLDGTRRRRAKDPNVTATFCPFCGAKLTGGS